MMRWAPYIDARGDTYPLTHLHPFRYELALNDGISVEIRVAFAMHCFTRARVPGDAPSQLYTDTRECRAFCPDRYALSRSLPAIARQLSQRKCGYAKNENYVTVDLQSREGLATRYGVFFNVRRAKTADGRAVLVTIQSAYELAQDGQLPQRGSIKFQRLIELTLDGIKPRPPRS